MTPTYSREFWASAQDSPGPGPLSAGRHRKAAPGGTEARPVEDRWDDVRRELLALGVDPDLARQVLQRVQENSGASAPGTGRTSAWPNPARAQDAAGFVSILRTYHLWAGKPSYRTMQRRIGNRFAASTLHNALHSQKLPSLDMVRAIITACEGPAEDVLAFSEAWRQLATSPAEPAGPRAASDRRPRHLAPVGESA